MTYLPRGLLVNLLQGLIIAAAYFRFATKHTHSHTHTELSCEGRLAWLQLAGEHFNLMKHFAPCLRFSSAGEEKDAENGGMYSDQG